MINDLSKVFVIFKQSVRANMEEMEPHVIKFPNELAFSDDELYEFCAANEPLNIERDKYGQIWIMTPSGSNSGKLNLIISSHLYLWNEKTGRGETFDSSAGFLLPNGAMRAPDAAWVSHRQWKKLTDEEKEKFAPVCPEFIVEVKSPTDNLITLQKKMEDWLDNGCELAWLIDPSSRKAWIYRPEIEPQIIHGFNHSITGEAVLPGFEFELSLLIK